MDFLFQHLPELAFGLFTVFAVLILIFLYRRFHASRREIKASMDAEEAAFEQRLLREMNVLPGGMAAPAAQRTAAPRPSAAALTGSAVPAPPASPLDSPPREIAPVGAPRESAPVGNDALVAAACDAIGRLQAGARRDGPCALPMQVRGHQVTLDDGRTRCLVVGVMPSPEMLGELLKRYDAVCVAQPGGDPVVVQRLPDVLLRQRS